MFVKVYPTLSLFYGFITIKHIQFRRVKDSRTLHRTFNVQPLYLRHENTGEKLFEWLLYQLFKYNMVAIPAM